MSMVGIKYQDGSTGSIVESSSQKITSGAAHVADQAVHPGEDSTLDRTWGGPKCLYAVSISTGTVKASAGVLYGYTGSTAGTFAIKDGANQLGVYTVSAGVTFAFPAAVTMATSITISASAGVATVFYV